MPTPMPAPQALAERVARTGASAGTVQDLARAVFVALSPAVPFAFACLATTDPATGLITGAVKSHDLPLGDQEFAAAEYGAPDINLFAEIAERPVPVGVLSLDTGGQPETCLRLRDYMTPQFGFVDEIRLACRSRGAVWGAVAVYRRAGEPAFTAAEGELLAALAEPVAEALQRILFAGPRAAAAGVPAVLVVDAEDRVTDATAAVEDRISDLGGWEHGALPASILAVVATARRTGAPVRTIVPSGQGAWTALQALPLEGAGGVRSVVVTVEAAAAAAVGQLTLAARGLTGREQDVTQLVLQGASTKDIASALHLSPHTVQDHLKAVFAKLGVSSRREMIGRLVAEG
ncbi:DNA-binding CsgD family transcriptional regulator [Motilibacter rhizosphaerae]|uniref:DNA-binding CsgD family transcriptional regulator n=1 Tax=Motilibacter rhizosphaerae TaxID=598652 RepID=A0A4Q7NAJ2_9ACTN|nr:helix-turn-helix transcriptional regulator [Motilibacter rhizosphaerae]RZS79952.1 DNA-binding CsgD family transcriptional regulator [Motilibacter rhizosphaerae]